MYEITLSIGDAEMARVCALAQKRGFAGLEDYLQSLLHADLKSANNESLEKVLLQRLDGPFVDDTPELRATITERIERRLQGTRE